MYIWYAFIVHKKQNDIKYNNDDSTFRLTTSEGINTLYYINNKQMLILILNVIDILSPNYS